MTPLLAIVFYGIAALAAGAGAYFGSYLKKKGENLATQEDIDKLVEQVSAVTKATEEIKAKISDDVWSRQKHWEMKRDVVFDASRKIARLVEVVRSLFVVSEKHSEAKKKGSDDFIEHWADALRDYNVGANELDQAAFLIGLVCGDETKSSVVVFSGYTERGCSENNKRCALPN